MSDKIRIGECRFGKGVFARSMIHKGEEVLRFTGPLIDPEKVEAKGARQCDPLQIGSGVYIDIKPPGVLVNHSCAPNAGIRDDVRLIAITEIRAGEEIFYDYSTTMSEDHWTLACLCGSVLCRGNVRDFKHLPLRTRHRYLRIGIVQSYLVRQFYRPCARGWNVRNRGRKSPCDNPVGAMEGEGVLSAVEHETWRPL